MTSQMLAASLWSPLIQPQFTDHMCLFVCLFICLIVCLFVYLFVCLSVYLCVSTSEIVSCSDAMYLLFKCLLFYDHPVFIVIIIIIIIILINDNGNNDHFIGNNSNCYIRWTSTESVSVSVSRWKGMFRRVSVDCTVTSDYGYGHSCSPRRLLSTESNTPIYRRRTRSEWREPDCVCIGRMSLMQSHGIVNKIPFKRTQSLQAYPRKRPVRKASSRSLQYVRSYREWEGEGSDDSKQKYEFLKRWLLIMNDW